MSGRCAIPGCRRELDLVYLGRGVCQTHWERLTADQQPADALARALGIPVADATTTEESMSETKKSETKSTKKTKATKSSKPKKERVREEGLVVFAFRLKPEERDAIHKTAGPANASRFVRTVAAAFANEDEAAFKALLKEAREARA